MERNLVEIPTKYGIAFINLSLIKRIEVEERDGRCIVRFSEVNGREDFLALPLEEGSSTLSAIRAWIKEHRLVFGIND